MSIDSVIVTAVVVFVSLVVSPLIKKIPLTEAISQPMLLIWFNVESLFILLNQEPEVARLAAVYLRWASLGLPGMVPTFPVFLRCS